MLNFKIKLAANRKKLLILLVKNTLFSRLLPRFIHIMAPGVNIVFVPGVNIGFAPGVYIVFAPEVIIVFAPRITWVSKLNAI